jgi:hypothetical protein
MINEDNLPFVMYGLLCLIIGILTKIVGFKG